MSIEDNYENYEIDVTAKFPAFLIDNNEEGYTLFSWEDEKGFEKIPSDRAFTIEGKGLSDDDESLLFQLSYKEGKSSQANRDLWDIPINKKEVYEELVKKGLEIVKEVASSDDKIAISSFSKEVLLDGKTYVVTYMAANKYIAGISMRDNYVRRIKERDSKRKIATD